MNKTKTYFLASILTFSLGACQTSQQISGNTQNGGVMAEAPNTLTAAEKKQGWKLLFDGNTTANWRGIYKARFPEKGWDVKDGQLSVLKKGGGGDIVTEEEFSNFELMLEAKLTPGANSGIKYYVVEQPGGKGGGLGLEFQILDDELHPDAKMGLHGNRTIGSLYDLMPAINKKASPIGEWNTVRIVSKNNHVEHWLNGTKVLEFERSSPEYRALVAASKYKNVPAFGEAPKGRILIQDHNDHVSYRNIKIRKI